MPKLFWSQCTDALEALRQNDHPRAMHLLRHAVSDTGSGSPSLEHHAKRQAYIAKLIAHADQAATMKNWPQTDRDAGRRVNVLFVLSGSTNGNHLALSVANALVAPDIGIGFAVSPTDSVLENHWLFPVQTYQDILERGLRFWDGRGPDIAHVWGLSTGVMDFCIQLLRMCSGIKLVVHQEESEKNVPPGLLGSVAGISALGRGADQRATDGEIQRVRLIPHVDERLFFPRPRNSALRATLGIPEESIVIAYLGRVGPGGDEEEKALYRAIQLLNSSRGCPAVLMRTHENDGVIGEQGPVDTNSVNLGAVARSEVPDTLAAADVLVVQGDHEAALPVRLLESLAMGRPVVLLGSNTAIAHGRDAYVLENPQTETIASAIAEVCSRRDLYEALGNGAVSFYLSYTARRDCYKSLRRLYFSLLETVQGKSRREFASDAPADPSRGSEGLSRVQPSEQETLAKLTSKIRMLELENGELRERLRSMPVIDPLCLQDPAYCSSETGKEEFGIIVFGHTRLDTLRAVLESLGRQSALQYTEVWLDGYQGNPRLKSQVEKTWELVEKYQVRSVRKQSGQFGFRKMLILGLVDMCRRYRDVLVLEDDCFPTRDAVLTFREELDSIRTDKGIFSVYGHHFLVEAERESCARFQGWGWATTSEKLMPMLRQLIECYSMTEERYLEFVKLTLSPAMKARIDITPPRQPSYVLQNFFAWDETLCLLTALADQVHRPTRKRTIYNCGMGEDSTHFRDVEKYRRPPFNLITPEEVWDYF